MKKKQQAGLTQELMEKLSQDAYCFNLDHDNEIGRLKTEIDRLIKDKEDLKRQLEVQESKLKEEHLKAIEGKKGEFEDLKDKNAELEDANTTLGSIVQDLEAKLLVAKEEAKKEYRKEGKCFDFMHKAFEGKRSHNLSVPELFALSVSLLYRGPTDPLGDTVHVFVPFEMEGYVDRAKKAMDLKNARSLGDALKRGDLSKFLKNDP